MKNADRKDCEQDTTSIRWRMWADGPRLLAAVSGVLGPGGGNVHCTVKVDGKVEHRSDADGSYEGAWCTAIVPVS